MPLPNQRLGEYILVDKIGQGAFGEVWRAQHHAWADQIVAIKIPTELQYVRNLQREGHAVHRLSHPGIVKAIAFDPFNDPPYFVTEYIPGTNLREWIARGSMPPRHAIEIMKQVLHALAHAHKNGVIHRDVKPENILIHMTAEQTEFAIGTVRLTDFGLGRAAVQASSSIQLSLEEGEKRGVVGSHQYMAPEQMDGRDVDGRADLYSCGVILFELLTGHRPAGMDVPSDVNPAVPRELDEVFRRAFARLERRFSSAEGFITALERAEKSAAVESPGARPPVKQNPASPPTVRLTTSPSRGPPATASSRKPNPPPQIARHPPAMPPPAIPAPRRSSGLKRVMVSVVAIVAGAAAGAIVFLNLPQSSDQAATTTRPRRTPATALAATEPSPGIDSSKGQTTPASTKPWGESPLAFIAPSSTSRPTTPADPIALVRSTTPPATAPAATRPLIVSTTVPSHPTTLPAVAATTLPAVARPTTIAVVPRVPAVASPTTIAANPPATKETVALIPTPPVPVNPPATTKPSAVAVSPATRPAPPAAPAISPAESVVAQLSAILAPSTQPGARAGASAISPADSVLAQLSAILAPTTKPAARTADSSEVDLKRLRDLMKEATGDNPRPEGK